MKITDRIKHAWNAFSGGPQDYIDRGPSSSRQMYKTFTVFNTSSYVSTIFNRIALDASMTRLKHVKVNPENEDESLMPSGLNECLNVEANIDQNYIQFMHDLVYSMFDEGVVAVVPVETNISPLTSGGYDILSMRVGQIVMWYPKHVDIMLYNESTGQNERITMPKKDVAIIENPLYAVVNGENSTLKRLIKKLNQLDNVDDLASAGRLDLLISVPYGIKTNLQRKMAEDRIANIEAQLASGRNGIAYTDSTEKVTQLNRPVNSQLKETVAELSQQLYNQLGLTASIFDGTATEAEMRNYYARSIDPILDSVVAEYIRKFLTKTARTQGQTIIYYRNMFKTVPIEVMAKLSDTLRRNSIASANEIRRVIGFKTSNDPRADELFNPNIADKNQMTEDKGIPITVPKPEDEEQKKAETLENEEEVT